MKLVIALVPKRSFRLKPTLPPTLSFSSSTTTERDLNTIFSTVDRASTDAETATESNTPTSIIDVTSVEVTEIPTTEPSTSTVSTTTRRPGRRRWNWERRNAEANQNPLWRNARGISAGNDIQNEDVTPNDVTASEVTDDSRSNNLILGRNGEPSGNAMSTRGDIPGDTSGSESDYVTRSTTPMPSSTSTPTPLPDDSDKLLTAIITMINFVS